ncbi:hypothetical protein [Rathayibacter toxicus]|nr:hypothetical protein [Rathayibacter toxicus]
MILSPPPPPGTRLAPLALAMGGFGIVSRVAADLMGPGNRAKGWLLSFPV